MTAQLSPFAPVLINETVTWIEYVYPPGSRTDDYSRVTNRDLDMAVMKAPVGSVAFRFTTTEWTFERIGKDRFGTDELGTAGNKIGLNPSILYYFGAELLTASTINLIDGPVAPILREMAEKGWTLVIRSRIGTYHEYDRHKAVLLPS